MSYTLASSHNSVTLGSSGGTTPTITSLSSRRTSEAMVISWYANPVEDNLFVDADGVIQTYSLEGVYSNTTTNINSFISTVNGLISGHQIDSGYTVQFSSSSSDVPAITTPLNCVVTSFEYEWTNESMTSITWSIDISIADAP